MRSTYPMAFLGALMAALAAGCEASGGAAHDDAGGPGGDHGGPGGDTLRGDTSGGGADAAGECGLVGTFRMTLSTAAEACQDCPGQGEILTVLRDGGDVRLMFGGYTLTGLVGADCRLTADACTGDDEDYLRLTLRLDPAAGGLTGVFDFSEIRGNRRIAAITGANVAFESVAAGACDPLGAIELAGPPSLTAGACDLAWAAGTVTVTRDSDTSGRFVVEWPDGPGIGVGFDPAACELSGVLGDPEQFDIWMDNGAQRTARITLDLSAAAVTGTLADRLWEPNADGQTCDGTFAFTGTRLSTTPQDLGAACTLDAPYVCRDGVCETERGEGCSACEDDCACTAPLECAGYPGVCARLCDPLADDCPAGQHCDVPGEAAAGGEFGCVPDGAGTENRACTRGSDCARGFVCHHGALAEQFGVALCERPCNPDTDEPCTGYCERLSGSWSYGSCLPACTGLDPAECGPDAFCLDDGYGTHCAPRPRDATLPDLGGFCGADQPYPDVCTRAATCVRGGGYRCASWCEDGCPADAPTCVDFFCWAASLVSGPGEPCNTPEVATCAETLHCVSKNGVFFCALPCSGNDADCPAGERCIVDSCFPN